MEAVNIKMKHLLKVLPICNCIDYITPDKTKGK